MEFTAQPEYTWKWSFDPKFEGLIFLVAVPPNWFHRKMQTLCLGIYWSKL